MAAGWGEQHGRSLLVKRKYGIEGGGDGVAALSRQSLLCSAEANGVVVSEVLANGSFDEWETIFDIFCVSLTPLLPIQLTLTFTARLRRARRGGNSQRNGMLELS